MCGGQIVKGFIPKQSSIHGSGRMVSHIYYLLLGVAFKPIEISPDLLLILFRITLIVSMVLVGVLCVRNLVKFLRARNTGAEKLRLLREFTEHGPEITLWLKDHKEELQKSPIATLNNQEFIGLINRDQELYERILEIYPDYPDTVMPPKELRQYLIELAHGQHRQTH